MNYRRMQLLQTIIGRSRFSFVIILEYEINLHQEICLKINSCNNLIGLFRAPNSECRICPPSADARIWCSAVIPAVPMEFNEHLRIILALDLWLCGWRLQRSGKTNVLQQPACISDIQA